MAFPGFLQLREIADHGCLPAAKGHVNECFNVLTSERIAGGLECISFDIAEAIQPFCKVVQLIHIHRLSLEALKYLIVGVDGLYCAVLADRISDPQRYQHLVDGVDIFVSTQREGDRGFTILRVFGIVECRSDHIGQFYHLLCFGSTNTYHKSSEKSTEILIAPLLFSAALSGGVVLFPLRLIKLGIPIVRHHHPLIGFVLRAAHKILCHSCSFPAASQKEQQKRPLSLSEHGLVLYSDISTFGSL